jgi:hypothetical protein
VTGTSSGGGQLSSRSLAEKICHLLEEKSEADHTKYSYAAAAEAIKRQAATTGGPTISSAYLCDLATGKVTTPGYDKLLAIARWAGYGLGYFGDDEESRKELDDLVKLKAAGVHDLATRLIGLDTDDRQAALDLIDHLRHRRRPASKRRGGPPPGPAGQPAAGEEGEANEPRPPGNVA